MEIIKKLFTTIGQPIFTFTSIKSSDREVVFKHNITRPRVEGEGFVIDMVNEILLNENFELNLESGKPIWTISENRVMSVFKSKLIELHLYLWIVVSGKKSLRGKSLPRMVRTTLYDNKFYEQILELLLDAQKYGIDFKSLDDSTVITPLHKFIANKFQSMAESNDKDKQQNK